MVSIIFIFIFFTIFVIIVSNNDLTHTQKEDEKEEEKEKEKKNFDPTLSRLLSFLKSTHLHHAAAAPLPPPLIPQHVFFQNFPIVCDDNHSNSNNSSRS